MKNVIPMYYKNKMEYQKVKCKADCNKIRESWLIIQAVLQAFFKPLKVLPARGFKLNKKNKM